MLENIATIAWEMGNPTDSQSYKVDQIKKTDCTGSLEPHFIKISYNNGILQVYDFDFPSLSFTPLSQGRVSLSDILILSSFLELMESPWLSIPSQSENLGKKISYNSKEKLAIYVLGKLKREQRENL